MFVYKEKKFPNNNNNKEQIYKEGKHINNNNNNKEQIYKEGKQESTCQSVLLT